MIGFITRGVEDRRTNVGLFEAFELEAAQRCHIKIASSDIREPQTFGRLRSSARRGSRFPSVWTVSAVPQAVAWSNWELVLSLMDA